MSNLRPDIPPSAQAAPADLSTTLEALARLLGRQAARELAETEQVDPVTPLIKDEGVGNDQP